MVREDGYVEEQVFVGAENSKGSRKLSCQDGAKAASAAERQFETKTVTAYLLGAAYKYVKASLKVDPLA